MMHACRWVLTPTMRQSQTSVQHLAAGKGCADCLLWGRRELGCTCEKAAGDAASPMKQYKVTLLPASTKQPPRTLADMFPKLQLARARAKR